jgi:hypothetical protein
MPFTVFPDVSAGPMSLGPGQISAPLDFPETAGGNPPAVFLRIVMLGDGCEPPDAPRPIFTVRASEGDATELREDRAVFVRDQTDPASDPVARAQLFIESEHVYAIRLSITRPGSRWQLRITNQDDGERRFTWVVADNEPESKQPWLNLPQTLNFNGNVSQDVTQSLDVRNLGTGRLTMSGGGLTTGSKFQLDQVPADIAPNHCGKLIITFNAPTAVGTTQELYTAISNDENATDSAHHNDRIRLVATTTEEDTGGQGGQDSGFGACRRFAQCGCRQYTPPPRGTRCATPNCRHEQSEHRPPR